VVLESGALVAWSRQGAVIAYHGSAETVIVRGLLDALDEFVAIRREAHALATRNASQPAQRLAAGRKLVERVARLKLAADGPNGLSLGRLMKDSSFEDVLTSLRTAAEFDLAEQSRRGDDQLQTILGAGVTIGLVFAFFQIWPDVLGDLGFPETPWNLRVSVAIGVLLAFLPAFLVWMWKRKRR